MRKRFVLSVQYSLLGIALGFLGISFSVMVYMAKDYNTFNTVYEFFGVSKSQQFFMSRLDISKPALLRCLNLSHALFITSAALLGTQTTLYPGKPVWRYLRRFYMVQFFIQALFLDPGVSIFLYMKEIGPFASIFFFRTFYGTLLSALRFLSLAELGVSGMLLLISCFQTPRKILTRTLLMVLFFFGICVLYYYMFRWLPANCIWMSKVASYVTFKSFPVFKPTSVNAYVSWLTLLLIISLVSLALYQISLYNKSMNKSRIFSSRVSAADTASRVFCHYLKNELIAQQTELQILRTKLPPEFQEDIDYILNRNQNVSRRLTVLRDTIRQQKMTIAPVEINQLLKDAAEQNSPIPLRLYPCEEPVWLEGSRDQLLEMINCLIRNAVEAKADEQQHQLIEIKVFPFHKYVEIDIANSGKRIDPESRELIFEPFYTTKSTKNNWGLGLSLCRNIATLHYGQIWVDEDNQHNTCMTVFHILLPYKHRKSVCM